MFIYYNWIYYISLIFGLVGIAFAKFPVIREKSENSKNGNINVVLFLAGMSSNLSSSPEEIPFLKIPLVGKVKPCPSRPDSGYPTNFGAVVKRCRKAECDCRKLLETSIITLNSWARNALQMTTAVVSLTHDEKSNQDDNEFKYYNYKLETIDSITPKSRTNGETDDVVIVSGDHKNGKPNSKDNYRFSDSVEKNNENLFQVPKDLSIVNALSSNPLPQFKYHKNEAPGDNGGVIMQRFRRNFIVEPENTQVFEMDAAFNEEPNEIVNLPVFRRSSKPDPFWDLLGIMSAMRKSFFGNYMNPSSDPQQRMAEEESGGNYNSLGKKQDLSLFKLVKTTFCNIKEQTRENNNGFIIVIFGGNLSDTTNPYSDFIQSVKYVEESTCPEKTLIIVTGDCPDNITGISSGNGDNGGRYERNKDGSIPVYAKGPKANIIAKAKDIPDIPVQIKAALSKKSEECKQMNMRNMDAEAVNKIEKEDPIFSKYLMDGDDLSDLKNKEKPKVIVKRDVSKMYQSGSIKKLLNKFAIYMWCILYFISFM